MNFNKSYILLLFVSIFISSCYYDVEETLYGTTECKTDNVTYSLTVLPIIESKCYKCHSEELNNGNVTLEGYENLKKYVDNGQLEGAINHIPGFSPMPKNEPQLIECDIAKIEKWIDEGAMDN